MLTEQVSTKLEYEVAATLDPASSGEWRAEAIDHEGDGECYVVLFSGPKAEQRAREYATWKNN